MAVIRVSARRGGGGGDAGSRPRPTVCLFSCCGPIAIASTCRVHRTLRDVCCWTAEWTRPELTELDGGNSDREVGSGFEPETGYRVLTLKDKKDPVRQG